MKNYESNFADKVEFQGEPPAVPDDTVDMPFDSVAPKHLFPQEGHDTYTGIPGDGEVPA